MLQQIQLELSRSKVTLIAVSKYRSNEAIQELYDQGQRHFAENRVQELLLKHPQLPQDISWHVIGHLQTNKVKYIAPFVHMIQSVDSEKVLLEINKEAAKNHRCIDILIQFKIAAEDTKYGFDLATVKELLASDAFANAKNIRVCGVMGMATFTEDKEQVKGEFRVLKGIFEELKAEFFGEEDSFKEISMGMSGDYLLAVKEGSTMVRIGSKLFA
ncbi:MAG: pyridoxal phosphate enzyme (YggS family) [Polaribacter sp.]|jgi:pyridoxal phosphate enzyme (YggS family)